MPLRLTILVVLVLLVGYGLIKALPLLSGPHISLDSPADGQTFADGVVVISGDAAHTEKLTLDGAPLLIDEKGHFSTLLTLPAGSAILKLTASDRFGTSESVTRAIFVPNQ